MLKAILRILCCIILCVLLVYAPEIYTAASAPYTSAQPRRVLLRVSICPANAESEEALLGALHLYMKEFPTVHLRIARCDAAALFSQPDPQADVLVFPADISAVDDRFLFLGAENSPILCAISASTVSRETAVSLAEHLLSSAD